MKISRQERFSKKDEETVHRGFADYNDEQGQSSVRHALALTTHDPDGVLLGALDGYVFFDWLTVSRLWVPSEQRGTGMGTALLLEAEAIAKGMGCVGSTLSTYDFQARPFYEKHGYEVFGVLPHNPRGHVRFFMRKMFGVVHQQA